MREKLASGAARYFLTPGSHAFRCRCLQFTRIIPHLLHVVECTCTLTLYRWLPQVVT